MGLEFLQKAQLTIPHLAQAACTELDSVFAYANPHQQLFHFHLVHFPDGDNMFAQEYPVSLNTFDMFYGNGKGFMNLDKFIIG